MFLKQHHTSKPEQDKTEEHKYVVKNKSKYLEDGESPPSFLRYLMSYIIPVIILMFILAVFRGGMIYIIILWIAFITHRIIMYEIMYPPERPATKDEVKVYKLSRKKEALELDKQYKGRLRNYDVYGKPKRPDDEYSREMGHVVYCHEKRGTKEEAYEIVLKKNEAKLRSEMEEKLKHIEEEYGENWREDFRKELSLYGFTID